MTRPVYPIIYPTLSTRPRSNVMADSDSLPQQLAKRRIGKRDTFHYVKLQLLKKNLSSIQKSNG